MNGKTKLLVGLVVLVGVLGPLDARGAGPATAPVGADALVSLNLPENAPLKVLLDYVSQEFGINFLYDDTMGNQRLTIRAPAKLPKSAVQPLLESALRMKGLALVDAGQPGWRRVVAMQQAARVAGADNAPVVTQVFKLKYADATHLDPLVKPFLSQPGASSFPLADQQLLVVSDYATNLKRVEELVESVDQPNQEAGIEFFPIKHADPARLTQQLEQLMRAKLRSQGGDERLSNTVETSFDARTNQIVVIAAKSRMNDAREIIKALDTEVAQEQSPIKFYKLANATAADVLATIRSLEGEEPSAGGGANGAGAARQQPGMRGTGSQRTTPGGIRDLKPTPLDQGNGTGASVTPLIPSATAGSGSAGRGLTDRGVTPAGAAGTSTGSAAYGTSGAAATTTSGAGTDPLSALRQDARARQAKVTADPNTNSIIVIAPPDVQRQYDQLIKALDKRRPQVLVECTIVTLDTTNNFELGVEIAQKTEFGSNKLITFSSFGLSTPDPTTGKLALIPGLGFNGALISSDIANVIVRALQQNTRARVTSAPRILVNDNNVGTLSSLSEFPYASVNASTTVATTSFGDYAQAGTEITVTPHISESDYLQLEYSVVLSSFTGNAITQGGTTLPPPRKSDSVQSEVTIPDGSTIIVGGLNRHNFNQTVDSIPVLGEIPVLKYLFSNRGNMDSTTTLFVFIRPVILRDDKFADLKFLSETDVKAAELPGDFPASEPLTIR
jgi:general secretion pathway protein D